MRPVTADAPVSDVRHQHRSDTNSHAQTHADPLTFTDTCYLHAVTMQCCATLWNVTWSSSSSLSDWRSLVSLASTSVLQASLAVSDISSTYVTDTVYCHPSYVFSPCDWAQWYYIHNNRHYAVQNLINNITTSNFLSGSSEWQHVGLYQCRFLHIRSS